MAWGKPVPRDLSMLGAWKFVMRVAQNQYENQTKKCICSRFWMHSHSSNGLALQRHYAKPMNYNLFDINKWTASACRWYIVKFKSTQPSHGPAFLWVHLFSKCFIFLLFCISADLRRDVLILCFGSLVNSFCGNGVWTWRLSTAGCSNVTKSVFWCPSGSYMVMCHGALASEDETFFKKEIKAWSKNKKPIPLSKDRLKNSIPSLIYNCRNTRYGMAFLKGDCLSGVSVFWFHHQKELISIGHIHCGCSSQRV